MVLKTGGKNPQKGDGKTSLVGWYGKDGNHIEESLHFGDSFAKILLQAER